MNYDLYRQDLIRDIKRLTGCYTGSELRKWENMSIVELENERRRLRKGE